MKSAFGPLSFASPASFDDHSRAIFVGPQVSGLPITITLVQTPCDPAEPLPKLVERNLQTFKSAGTSFTLLSSSSETAHKTRGERREFTAKVEGRVLYFRQYFFRQGRTLYVANVSSAEPAKATAAKHFDEFIQSLSLKEGATP